MPYNVNITYTDTGTGEETVVEATLPEITAETVALAIRTHLADNSECPVEEVADHIPAAWVDNGPHCGFIYRSDEPYFGNILIVGVVYQV